MRIGFISSDWADFAAGSPGGCTWIRMLSVSNYLGTVGHETACGELGWIEGEGFVVVPTYLRLEQTSRDPIVNPREYFGNLDVVVLKLFMHKDAKSMIEKAREWGQVVVIDIDDWFMGLPTTNIAFETTHPNADAVWNRDHFHNSYPAANALIHSTQFLADGYAKFNKNHYVVRNSVDPNIFMRRFDIGSHKPVIGWVGIMLWRQHDVEELKGILGPILEDYDLQFYHAGMLMDRPKQFAELTGMNPDRLIEVTGTNVWNYGNILLPMDIGLVPLDGSPFNEAKSSLKGIEYAMTGIPFIASNTAEYRLLHDDGAGRIAKKKIDWRKHIEDLLDPEVRRQEAQKGWDTVMDKYNLSTKVNEWSDTIIEIYRKEKGL